MMIETGVKNIDPAGVENCLKGHEEVADVAVIGVPGPVWDQSIKTIIICKTDTEFPTENFIAHAKERLARYKKPKIIEFAEKLPGGADFQLDRAALDATHGGSGLPESRLDVIERRS